MAKLIKHSKKRLSDKILKNINFQKIDLSKKNLKNKIIDKCDFWESNLKFSSFQNCKIKNTIFSDAELHNSSFKDSKLYNVNFSHSNLKNVNFKGCSFENINLREAIFNDKTKWPKKFNPNKFGAIYYKNKKKSSIKRKEKTSKIANKIVKVLTQGKGYYVVNNYFDKYKIKKAQRILKDIVFKDKNIKQNLNKFSKDKKFCQKWIINLLNINPIFKDLIQPKLAMDVFNLTLGKNFICGFFEANCLLPGARGQFPHIDYPYNYNYENGEYIPFKTNGKFLFNCQILIPLNDMTKENGSTAFLDGSYKFTKFPKKSDLKKFKFKQIKAPLGSMVLFNGLTWHTSMPNYSYDKERYCLLGQYIPHFVKPMIDIKSTTKNKIYKNDRSLLKQLLGINSTFPIKKK